MITNIVRGHRVKWVRQKKSSATRRVPRAESAHPLPWRNRPSDGLNHVTDANGRVVYHGCDAAEMFARYSAEVQAERAG